MPQRGEFRATTDQMLALVERIRAAEEVKRQLAMGSPEFVESARETMEVARLTFRWAQMQLEMALAAESKVARGETANDIHLLDIEPRPIDRILANWREAQLRFEIARPGSQEAESAAKDIERYREEYQVTHELVISGEAGTLVASSDGVVDLPASSGPA